jgi:hypothetical protein
MSTPADVAQWMVQEIEREGMLYQDEAAANIASKFGDEFTYDNDNGNTAIRRDVLAVFRKLTDDFVVWERGERLWRKREQQDEKGKRQVD